MVALLLDELLQLLDPRLHHQLENEDTRAEVSAYLDSLLVNDDLLSTESFTTTTSRKRTLIEEIAELDQRYRQTELRLTAITNANKDAIVAINQDLHTINNEIRGSYTTTVRQLHDLLARENVVATSTRNKNSTKATSTSEKLASNIRTTSTVLTHVDLVLDYLELPTLCRLCIMQGNYQESLEISMTAQSLTIKYPSFAVFRHIRAQVEHELRLMVNGLIRLLNTNLKQSQLLRVFQILRKVDLVAAGDNTGTVSGTVSGGNTSDTRVAKERYLKMVYLNSRSTFIANEIATLRPLIKFNKFTYLKRYIEIYREYLFNSLSLYQLLFGFDSGSATDVAGTVSSISDFENDTDDGVLLLHQFVETVALLLVQEFQTHFPLFQKEAAKDDDKHIDNDDDDDDDLGELEYYSQRDGLILQLIYLCRSLAKFNLDFECILVSSLCYGDQVLFDEADWLRNLQKVRKFRS